MSIKLDAVIGSVVNFSMQQNRIPVIRSLTLFNDGEQPVEELTVTVGTEPAFALPFSRTIQLIGAGESLRPDGIDLVLSPEYLFSLEERLSGNLTVKAEKNGEILAQEVYPVDVLPYDMWGGTEFMPEYISAFVTPNHSSVIKIINSAAALLEKWTGSPSFTAYQSGSPDTVQKQAAAIYGAIQLENIAYCVAPASFEPVGQRIRLTDAVINQKLGTCLDLAVLFASCLEYVGINPLLIFLDGHAFAGCWLTEENFPECVQDDLSLLTKRAADGINEICMFECTSAVAGKNQSFTDACRSAETTLQKGGFQFFVDVARCRASGIRPLPVREKGENGEYVYNGERENNAEATSAPEEIRLLSGKTVSGEMNKQQLWERKLLDLSLRNTLISFRVTKNAVQLIVPAVEILENQLAEGEEFKLLEKPAEITSQPGQNKIYPQGADSEAAELLKKEFDNKRLRTYLSEIETEKALTSVYRAARVALEENGANTLYLAMGFLRWYESDISEKARYAPLILYPVELVRKSAAKAYTLRVRDDEPQFNVTLLEMLRVDFGLNITGLDPLPMDESGIDTRLVFSQIRQAVMGKSRWDVEELAFVGLFSFNQFIMWNDLRNRSDDLQKNKIVQSLIAGKTVWEQKTDFPTPDNIDDNYTPADNAVPLVADSSQLAAVCAAGAGESFVLHGPPGTGKSQTITNMIANALYQGKSVLFIAEKMAALEVVERRLDKIGLGAFCLELHSNKAKKKDVLAQLDQALSIGKIKAPEQYASEAERLLGLRRELNDTMRLIHKKQPSGFSLYDAIGQYERYIDVQPEFGFQKAFLAKLTPEIYKECEENLKQLQVTVGLCGGVADHPLADFKSVSYSQSLKTELGEKLTALAQLAEKLAATGEALSEALGTEISSLGKLEKADSLFKALSAENTLPAGLWGSNELAALEEKLAAVCRCGKERDGLEKSLSESFNGGIFTFDAESAIGQWNLAETKWALGKSMGQSKVFKSLQVLAKTPLDKAKTPDYLKAVIEYKEKQKEISQNDGLMTSLFGLLWNGGKADFDRLEAVYKTVKRGRELAAEIGADTAKAAAVCCNYGEFSAKNSQMTASLENDLTRLKAELAELSAKTGLAVQDEKTRPADLAVKAGKWAENLDALRDWSGYRSCANALAALGTEEIPRLLEQGRLTAENILPAFYRNIAQSVAAQTVESEQDLSSFNGAIFSRVIENYKECAEQFALLTQQELAARLSAKVPAPGASAASSETGILQKAIKSGGRMMSIRKLFDSIPNLLRRLCPCMLMSPISVAQYIDPKYPPFDLVIFDEASQMSTCEAVGAIARGENLIVVGDPKQLPPTSFFDSVHVDEENFEKEDMESILDDCLALSMPQEHLLWHYRSRHESLIAFSNSNYYENKLFTFPSPDDTKSAVRHVQVEGVYERGKSKQNRAEAEAVIAEIVRRLRDPELRKRSMGVVTFSSVQQNLIDDLLLETLAKDPELEAAADGMYEPIFVKNLENVQGDERDVIMFSVGYGPDENGKVALNFGPLNRDGGWRRLNVAVSRARREMIIFSVLRPEQINLNRSSSEGVAGLKAFLEYASRGRNALPSREVSRAAKTDALTEVVAQKLREQGWQVNTGIGCSAYKMDLGILDADGEYILGVMLDGASYAGGGTARDRNIGQASVLKSLGWNIHRLWAIDWWENPDRELEKITAAAEQAIKNKAEGVTEEEPKPAPKQAVFERLAEQKAELPKYEEAVLPQSGDSESFMLIQNDKRLLEQINLVLEKEAPVERGVLCKRLFKVWGIARRNAKIDARVDDLLGKSGAMITDAGESRFIWKAGQMPFEYQTFRIPGEGEKRSADEIPPQEYGAAAAFVISSQLGLSEEDIIREVGRLFGFARVTEPLKQAVANGLYIAVQQGRLKKENGRYQIG